jgi:type I restriction-modification system DNA methylase subunit
VKHSEIVNFPWGVADLIRDTFQRGKHQGVILPLTVLRRLDCVLACSKENVLAKVAGPDLDGVCTSEILPLQPMAAYSQRHVM